MKPAPPPQPQPRPSTPTDATLRAPLHVLHVAGSAQWGGGEIFLQQMAEHLDRSRFRMHVLCPEEGPLKKELTDRGVPCTTVPLSPLGDPRPLRRLSSMFREWKADVVQSHGARANFYTRLAAGKIPNISTVHNALSDYPVHPLKKTLYLTLDNFSAGKASAVVFVSESLRKEFLDRAPRWKEKTRVIHNGVDLTRFDPAKKPPEKLRAALSLKPVWTLGIIGRMTPQKGHIYLLEALRRALPLLPTFQLLIVGDGLLRPWLENTVTQYGLRPYCHFLGVRRDIPELLSLMDVLVVPSVSEGFPYVVIEGLALQRAVIATRVNGIPEILRADRDGYLVPPRQPEKIEEALYAILKNPAEAKARGENGARRVREEFDARKAIGRWEALYLELTRGRENERPPANTEISDIKY